MKAIQQDLYVEIQLPKVLIKYTLIYISNLHLKFAWIYQIKERYETLDSTTSVKTTVDKCQQYRPGFNE